MVRYWDARCGVEPVAGVHVHVRLRLLWGGAAVSGNSRGGRYALCASRQEREHCMALPHIAPVQLQGDVCERGRRGSAPALAEQAADAVFFESNAQAAQPIAVLGTQS